MVDELARLICAQDDRRLEQAIFGSSDPVTVATHVADFARTHVGPPTAARFYRRSSGMVVALDCEGAGAVVLKIRPATNPSELGAAQDIQRFLGESGFPAPMPLVGPTALGAGIATMERFVPGTTADGHDPVIRAEIAARLSDFVGHAARYAGDSTAALTSPTNQDDLWGEPHDLRFDFEATSTGADWIDDIATDAQAKLRVTDLAPVVAHFDWRVENLGFHGDRIVGVFDWDSVGVAPEAVAVGQSSAVFSTDWAVGHATLPSVEEMQAFVADYEQARGAAFTPEEADIVEAANLMVLAYATRCEHSDRTLHPELVPDEELSWASLLRRRVS